MTTTGRDINSINYRSINLVFVDSDKNILFCDTLSNNDYAIRNVEELEVYINDYLGGNLFLKTINLDDAYLYKLIPRYTKTYNKGIIDGNYHLLGVHKCISNRDGREYNGKSSCVPIRNFKKLTH